MTSGNEISSTSDETEMMCIDAIVEIDEVVDVWMKDGEWSAALEDVSLNGKDSPGSCVRLRVNVADMW
jgi:hypothetical protein